MAKQRVTAELVGVSGIGNMFCMQEAPTELGKTPLSETLELAPLS